MRVTITHPNAGTLRYEIRGIVDFAQRLAATGITLAWENIGDPIAKGETIPQWMLDIVAQEAGSAQSYAYSPTKGLQEAREFLAQERTAENGRPLLAENILFFNGLGDAISKLYGCLHPGARVLGPNPAYPSHSVLEAAHSNAPVYTYQLDPANNWLPDPQQVRETVAAHPEIAALLIINPDNPTGMLYPEPILREFVAIAREFGLFLVADEIYAKLSYNITDFVSLAAIAEDVPTIIMRGLSKEIPWPGSRCGWLEFYNTAQDADFQAYIESIEAAKMVEVCSTTLPQAVLPRLLGDDRYPGYLAQRRKQYAQRAGLVAEAFADHPMLTVVAPKGAFYVSVTFTEAFLQTKQFPPAANGHAQQLLDDQLATDPDMSFDKAFCYRLLASTGICVVPLSTGFNSKVHGFRMTLLEPDTERFAQTLAAIKAFCA